MAITATAGLILLILLDEYRAALGDWLTKDPGQAASRLRMTFGSLAVFIAGPILGFSAYFWRLGGRIVTTERFPPPGMAVVRDTHVLQNGAARRPRPADPGRRGAAGVRGVRDRVDALDDSKPLMAESMKALSRECGRGRENKGERVHHRAVLSRRFEARRSNYS
ncbi:MAG: hypothetical protein ACM3ZC_00920 [Bacteroidota bacterium]